MRKIHLPTLLDYQSLVRFSATLDEFVTSLSKRINSTKSLIQPNSVLYINSRYYRYIGLNAFQKAITTNQKVISEFFQNNIELIEICESVEELTMAELSGINHLSLCPNMDFSQTELYSLLKDKAWL